VVVFAESAKPDREFVYRRSSPHVATEATGLAGGLGKRKLHGCCKPIPISPPRQEAAFLRVRRLGLLQANHLPSGAPKPQQIAGLDLPAG
jgi:hypothetical protein